MLAAATSGASCVLASLTSMLADLGPLYSIPIGIAAFGAVVATAIALMPRKG